MPSPYISTTYVYVYVFVVSVYTVKTYVDNADLYGIISVSNGSLDTFGHYHIYLY